MELCLTWFRQWIADKNKITSSLPFQTILKNLLLQSCFFSPQNVQFFKASKQVYTFLALFCEVEKNLKMDGICSNISIMDEQFPPTFFGTWIDANWMQKKAPNHRLNLTSSTPYCSVYRLPRGSFWYTILNHRRRRQWTFKMINSLFEERHFFAAVSPMSSSFIHSVRKTRKRVRYF